MSDLFPYLKDKWEELVAAKLQTTELQERKADLLNELAAVDAGINAIVEPKLTALNDAIERAQRGAGPWRHEHVPDRLYHVRYKVRTKQDLYHAWAPVACEGTDKCWDRLCWVRSVTWMRDDGTIDHGKEPNHPRRPVLQFEGKEIWLRDCTTIEEILAAADRILRAAGWELAD